MERNFLLKSFQLLSSFFFPGSGSRLSAIIIWLKLCASSMSNWKVKVCTTSERRGIIILVLTCCAARHKAPDGCPPKTRPHTHNPHKNTSIQKKLRNSVKKKMTRRETKDEGGGRGGGGHPPPRGRRSWLRAVKLVVGGKLFCL